MFIATERTPNPQAMKFLPDRRLADAGSWSFERTGFDPAASPLAARLFRIEGVARIFIAPEFLTVSRATDGPGWDQLRYQIIAALADHLESGDVVVTVEAAPSGDEDDIEGEIRQVLGLYIRPGVAREGGEVLFERFDAETGVLRVRMQGACGGCPSARLTLKASVERIVRRYVPEVLRVEETAAEPPAEARASGVKRWLADMKGRVASPARGTMFTHAGRALQSRSASPKDPIGG